MNHWTFFLRHPLACAAVTTTLLLGAASPRAADAPDAARAFDAAMLAYERSHWDAAYAAFAVLADQGHPEAARVALQMWRHGPVLYRTSFAADVQQVERWSRVWGCGSEPASHTCQRAPQAR